ncbi:MAG TPA: hypothetical protein VFX61_10630 [Micromonosporaceae bacterium]|nr:hypothetical protein [Micromonosporaceae bacterium]
MTLTLTRTGRRIAGLLLLSIVAVEFGGYYLTRVASNAVEVTGFQQSFARAGHAHAGVLLILSLIAVVFTDATGAHGIAAWVSRLSIPLAAILMPLGFFLASTGGGRTEPNGLISVLWLGAASLTVGVVTLGLLLLRSGFHR